MSQAFPADQQDDHLTGAPQDERPMSKNQLKKLARRQRILDLRPQKRKLEKERRRQRRQELAKLRDNDDEIAPLDTQPRRTLMRDSENKFRVVIDMDFEDFMTDAEIAKAAKQVSRVYAINRHSKRPCQLYVSSLKGKIRDRFAITCTGYSSWDANVSEKDYQDLFLPDICTGEETLKSERDKIRERLIYLTGDTEDDLPDVEEILKDESRIFVIGGLVDHNRHKDLCLKRAQERGIRTARLPIKRYVTLCQRHILSMVAVFEIMLNVLGHHEPWREVFLKCIPKRKIKHESQSEIESQRQTSPE